MTSMPRLLAALATAATIAGLAIETASAQSYPSRPITLVVPFPAGGGNDALARLVAERMSKTLGQQVVVENRGGAGGTVATRAIAKSPPDGHTILLSYTGTFAINPTLYPNAGYDPRKDFAPIGIDRDADQRAGVAPIAAGAIDRRPDRLRQDQSRQDQLRVRARHRRPYLDRDVRAQRRHQAHQHPLQGQRQRRSPT